VNAPTTRPDRWRRTLAAGAAAQRGQGLAEYALILALIVVVAIAALVFLGTNISTILSAIAQSL
jgi:pilus assembly protein Flp/PilA